MATSAGHHEIASVGINTLQPFRAATELLWRRGDRRQGGHKWGIGEIIQHWDEHIPAQGEEFRTDESVLEQHFLASLPVDNWRVPYGLDSPQARELVGEIMWRRRHGISLDGLAWSPSDDSYAPANDPNHPFYLPKDSRG
ncbi:MAG: hypothetical protein K8J31_17750 [Anaerolineae bacterium]|nr:hypothetical protein [Anaerolineae bacterium]